MSCHGGQQPLANERRPLEDSTSGCTTERPPSEDSTSGCTTERPPSEDSTSGCTTERPPSEDSTSGCTTERPPSEDSTSGCTTERPPSEDSTSGCTTEDHLPSEKPRPKESDFQSDTWSDHFLVDDVWYDHNFDDEVQAGKAVGQDRQGVMALLENLQTGQNKLIELYTKMSREQEDLSARIRKCESNLKTRPFTPAPQMTQSATPAPRMTQSATPAPQMTQSSSPATRTIPSVTPVLAQEGTQSFIQGTLANNYSYRIASIPPPKGPKIPESDICQSQLISVDAALQKYSHLLIDSQFGAFAVRLAKEVFFGDNVLKQCTTRGRGGCPALPHKVLTALKMTLFYNFPDYWTKPEAFEQKWIGAQESIGQMCKHLRRKNP